ncbi:MAG: serine/threonine-protein phosphatase, partial [Pseudomonadota bacterium]|nr:serine/threonine-protein phosphatase [Pseudomonadota bacterium]
YCIAGHDAPVLARPGQPPRPLNSVGGLPLCIFERFTYPDEHVQLQPGDLLVMITDGVAEARAPDGAMFGRRQVPALLHTLPPQAGPRDAVQALYADVKRFTRNAAPSDDIAILAIQYRGPAGG